MAALFACGGDNAGQIRKRTDIFMIKVNRAMDAGMLINKSIIVRPRGNNVIVGARD